MVWSTHGWSLLLLMGYPLLGGRIFVKALRQNISHQDAALYACSCVLGKFAQVRGTLSFLQSQLLRHRTMLIEYKN
jgi:hypothetical protein